MAIPLNRATHSGIDVAGPVTEQQWGILSDPALAFVADLARRFGARRDELLALRHERQAQRDAGHKPDFLPETAGIRASDWRVRPAPADLRDRRVEITGPVDRKMIINALNSGARVYMADFEDSHSPVWSKTLEGQINLRDAVDGSITFTNPAGKEYRLAGDTATLVVRPRGWHLPEARLLMDGLPIAGALMDFGLYFFHNARSLIERGTGPYFYLPKMESHLEARMWADIFDYAEHALGLDHGTIRATVLIETLPAVFEMEEILYELRDYVTGLNCGRWDYIFSFIKCFNRYPDHVLPDRSQVTMTTHFLRSYSQLLIQTCHRRGAHAMGGMAAQIPIKDDPEANREALEKVRADKLREVRDGHDGTWVAHPGLVPVAMGVFDAHMPGPNQLDRLSEDVHITTADLLQVPEGTITEGGVQNNISAALCYMAAWLGGQGAVPIHHLMEDVATAEIARSQLWQWIRHPAGRLDDGREVTRAMVFEGIDRELTRVRKETGQAAFEGGHFETAAGLLRDIVTREQFREFLTLDDDGQCLV